MFLDTITIKELLEYKEMVIDVSKNSPAIKRKVGVLIIDGSYIYAGYNYPLVVNMCESLTHPNETNENVVHAEENAIFHLINKEWFRLVDKNIEDLNGLLMISTFTPCYNCCRLMIQAGIKHLIYLYQHKKNWDKKSETTDFISPEEFLKRAGITVNQIDHLIEIKQRQ
jgi:deoxycytidylate deaminase